MNTSSKKLNLNTSRCNGKHGKDEVIMKERIQKINEVAQENFEKAQGMLEMLNEICGTKFGWLAKRVVIFENPNGSTAEKYAHCHDAACWMQ